MVKQVEKPAEQLSDYVLVLYKSRNVHTVLIGQDTRLFTGTYENLSEENRQCSNHSLLSDILTTKMW